MWPHGSQCFDEGDRGNWADRWFHGTRVGHTGPGYPSTRVLTYLITSNNFYTSFQYLPLISFLCLRWTVDDKPNAISFIQNKKRHDPRTDPAGTPETSSDEAPSRTTFYVWLIRKMLWFTWFIVSSILLTLSEPRGWVLTLTDPRGGQFLHRLSDCDFRYGENIEKVHPRTTGLTAVYTQYHTNKAYVCIKCRRLTKVWESCVMSEELWSLIT